MSTTPARDAKRSSHRGPYQGGDVIDGKYELVRRAGKGSMGEVWVATHLALQSPVAIKILNAEVLLPVIAERLLREARAAAMLNHPSIVRVFDLGETPDAGPYIVMELLGGESLRERLDRSGPLAPEEALAVLLPIAGAMQAAHEQGIVHRDLKPDNVMLVPTDSGAVRPKLVDFGIAKVNWSGADGTGAVMIGTPDYMSPEQVKGAETLDHRTDVWSFCVLLYETLSGDTPFAGETTWELLHSIVEVPAPSLEPSTIDAPLWAILERGLRKDPAERWSSMRELGDALAGWLSSRGVLEDACGASLRVQWLENGTPDRVKERMGAPLSRRHRRTGSPAPIQSALRDTRLGLSSSVRDSRTPPRSTRASAAGSAARRGRRVALAVTLLAGAVSLGAVALARLDPRLGLLSSMVHRIEPLPAISSPPAPWAAAAPDVPAPAPTAAPPLVERSEVAPVPVPSASASSRVVGAAWSGAALAARNARAAAATRASSPPRGAEDPFADVRATPPVATAPPAAPIAPVVATPPPRALAAPAAPGALPVLDPTSPL